SGMDLVSIVRNHHEWVDVTGYTDRLRGDAIPLGARMVAVCDAFDALVNDRPYRLRLSTEEAVAVLHAGAGRQWDRELVDAFIAEVPRLYVFGAA
ncbi:MAG TPA: HD domain-containing phosphohydrolase, partial [Candidatus Dormibacteraeota bacterium]|nr:HD domain-containing phosphohydrolase [Candidatus Dormibacteraeota bacterium]